MKGNRTNVGQRVEQFFNNTPRVEYSVQQVAEHLGVSPNTVGQKVLGLFEDGFLLRRMKGIARGRHYVYIKAPNRQEATPMKGTRKIVTFDQLPAWVLNMAENEPEGSNPDGFFWTVTDSGVYEAWARPEMPTSFYHPRVTKLPEGVDAANVVDWYDLPAWVKGSYRNDAEMRRLQSYTWVRVSGAEERYNAYTPEGEYAGPWARE